MYEVSAKPTGCSVQTVDIHLVHKMWNDHELSKMVDGGLPFHKPSDQAGNVGRVFGVRPDGDDEQADRAGGRRNLVLLLGRKTAAMVFALAAIATPTAIVFAVLTGAFPAFALIGVLPGWFVVPAVRWAFARPAGPVPIPAMSGNVVWNLATNLSVAVGLGLAAWMR